MYVKYLLALEFVRLALQAEELMSWIEKVEEQLAYDDPDKKTYHLCIVNLVIG